MDKTAIVVAIIYGIFNLAATIIGAKKASTAVNKADLVDSKVQRIEQSVGPVNGESIHEVLQKVRQFQEYQKERNHDIIGLLTSALISQSIIARHQGIELPSFKKPEPYEHPEEPDEKGH